MRIALLLVLLCGCSTALQPKERMAIAAALAAQNPTTAAQPPITLTTKFAGGCPYCGYINLSIGCVPTGGMTITNLTAGTTNYTTRGNLQSWTISFRCQNCFMPFADYRDQWVPEPRTLRLPLNP